MVDANYSCALLSERHVQRRHKGDWLPSKLERRQRVASILPMFTRTTTLLIQRITLVLAALVALSGPSASSARVGAVSGVNTVYVAPSGSDGNLCTQTAPCLTLDRGYRSAAD